MRPYWSVSSSGAARADTTSRWRACAKSFPKEDAPAELVRETYNGVEIVSSKHGAHTLYNASEGQWGFLSNNLDAIKDAIDRASGRKKEGILRRAPVTRKFSRSS